jgi:thiamine-monophosphate kinase
VTAPTSTAGGGPLRVGDLDESALLERVVPLLPTGAWTQVGPGDDAAVVEAPDGRVVVSTDVLVEDHHFRRRWSTGYDVGRRAAAQNLADVAAMGAEPTALVVCLVVPRDLEVDWVADLARGLAAACSPHGVGVVGGDLSGGEHVVVAVTVHGDLAGRPPVLRSGARPGDVVALAGVLGRSAAGHALLAAGAEAGDVPHRDALVAAYLCPDPPLAAGPAAARAGASSLIDLSDGLLRDAGRVALASGVVVDLHPRESLAADVAAVEGAARALGVDPLRWVLSGGEDHGMLATFPPGARLPGGYRPVGQVLGPRAGAAAGTVLVEGGRPPVTGLGWDHFAEG